MVCRFIRDGSLFRENSAGKLGCKNTALTLAVSWCPKNLLGRQASKLFNWPLAGWPGIAPLNQKILSSPPSYLNSLPKSSQQWSIAKVASISFVAPIGYRAGKLSEAGWGLNFPTRNPTYYDPCGSRSPILDPPTWTCLKLFLVLSSKTAQPLQSELEFAGEPHFLGKEVHGHKQAADLSHESKLPIFLCDLRARNK